MSDDDSWDEIVTFNMTFSIVVLTYNRKDVLEELLIKLSLIQRSGVEVIIVDNGSDDGTASFVKENFANFQLVELQKNYGAVGRNKGLAVSTGKYVITIDDDILGLDDHSLNVIQEIFNKKSLIGAVCFRVLDYYSGDVCNWCHPYKVEEMSDSNFETTEITEGAVVFRNEMLKKIGLYTEEFFISHEGADLAARIFQEGYEIHYTSLVHVKHKYSTEARDNWRRYYYDTRNDFWLVTRNYRFVFGIRHLLWRLPITFIYSVRDGYLRYWIKAVKDSIIEFPEMLRQRRPISISVHKKMRYLNRNKPGFIYFFKKRFFSRQVKI